MENGEEIQAIANEIVRYLHQRPFAADTLDGIVKWWIKQQRVEEQTRLVKQALSLLETQGFVVQRSSATGQTFFKSAESLGGNNSDKNYPPSHKNTS